MTSERVAVASVSIAVVLTAGVGIGGYLVGQDHAATRVEFDRERGQARSTAFRGAERQSYRQGFTRGYATGAAVGRKRGSARGRAVGTERGEAEVARRAAAAEAAERARNCGAPLFVEGYCPTDEEVARENAAEEYCGAYDPSRVQPDGSYLPKPGC